MSSGKFGRHENNMPMYVSISVHMAVKWRIENQDNDAQTGTQDEWKHIN